MKAPLLLQVASAASLLLCTYAHPIGNYPRDEVPTSEPSPCAVEWTQKAYKNGVTVSYNGVNYKSLITIKDSDTAPGDKTGAFWKWSNLGACSAAATDANTTPTQSDPAPNPTFEIIAPSTETTDPMVPFVLPQMYLPPVPPPPGPCAPLWAPQAYPFNTTVSWGSQNYNSMYAIPETDTEAPGANEAKWAITGPCVNGEASPFEYPSYTSFVPGGSVPDGSLPPGFETPQPISSPPDAGSNPVADSITPPTLLPPPNMTCTDSWSAAKPYARGAIVTWNSQNYQALVEIQQGTNTAPDDAQGEFWKWQKLGVCLAAGNADPAAPAVDGATNSTTVVKGAPAKGLLRPTVKTNKKPKQKPKSKPKKSVTKKPKSNVKREEGSMS
ncbi:hypothetical protein HDU81_007924 [Chytriomyces hyalinus]|nr:hypothetical protein HDU81_007924 [Chytriomyces hyalinus]